MNPVIRLGAGCLCLLLTQTSIAQVIIPQKDFSHGHEIFTQLGFRYFNTQTLLRTDTLPQNATVRKYPVAQIGYRQFFRKRWAWSTAMLYKNEVTTISRPDVTDRSTRQSVGFQAGVQWFWMHRSKLLLYSGVYHRYEFETIRRTAQRNKYEFRLDLLATPVGFRFGNRYGFYGELTFADSGYYTTGFFYKL